MRKFLILSLLAGLAAGPSQAFAQGKPQNLNFEEGKPGEVPTGWLVPSGLQQDYSATLTEENPKGGKRCARLARAGNSGKAPYGNFKQTVEAAEFRGKRVRLRAAVRADVSGESWAGLWLRADRPNQPPGFFDNMHDRPIRDAQWKYYEVTGAIGQDVETLTFGLLLVGDRCAWLDDVSLEIIGDR